MDKKGIIILVAAGVGFLTIWCLVMFWIGPMIVSDPIADPCWEYVRNSEELEKICGHIEGITLFEDQYVELPDGTMQIPVEAWTEDKIYAIDIYIEKIDGQWVVIDTVVKGESEKSTK